MSAPPTRAGSWASTAPKFPGKLTKALRVGLTLLAVAYLALFLGVALGRLGYPYELEWMEGGMHEHVRRILAGEPIYTRPSLEFTAYIYPPFYYVAGALVTKLIGAGLPALRTVSLLSALGIFGMIFLIVKRETRSIFSGLVAAGLFAACFRAGGAWLDLARNDSLLLLLALGGIFVLRARPDTAGSVTAAVLFGLGFLTKQTALMVALPLAIFCLSPLPGTYEETWRRRLIFPGLLALLAGGGSLLMNGLTGGWYGWYIFSLPRQHAIEAPKIVGFWAGDLLPLLLPATILLAFFLFGLRRRRVDFWFWVAAFAGLIGAAWFSRMHSGGYDNVLLPAHAALAIGAGAGLHRALALSAEPDRSGVPWMTAAVLMVAIIQFSLLLYDPRKLLPTQADREAGDRLVALMAQTPGDVWVPFHGHLGTLAGKRDFSQGMALDDVFRAEDRAITERLETEIRDALRTRRFGAVILDYTPWGVFQEDLDRNYEHRGHLFRDPDVLMPVTGLDTRPEELYVRRD